MYPRTTCKILYTLGLTILPALAGAQEDLSYVGSDACAECHADAYEAWSGSHHAKAWTQATPDNILADFAGSVFEHQDTVTRFREENGTFIASVTEGGTTTDRPVHSVVGITPLQQYLFETEPGTLQSFDVVWDVEQERWYHLYPDQILPPDDGLHWSGPYKNWNARCAECHATGYTRNYDIRQRGYASVQAEIGVGCEACHGPASAHLNWVENGGTPPDDLDRYGFSMRFDAAATGAEQCAGCHARREALSDGNPRPGTPFHDAYNLALLRPGLYHADGQILDEVYVYGSFLQSKMYARGVGCGDCHTPHSAELVADGNAVCTQCHSEAGNPAFPTLRRAAYDAFDHTRHASGTDGAQCVSCHMIERDYMGIDGRRDHSFRIPRPDLASVTGAPDACTDCHQTETQAWAAEQIAAWFPDDQYRGGHYGVVLARGRIDPFLVKTDLESLALDPLQPGIVRATALFLLQDAPDAGLAERLLDLRRDPDPLVRAAMPGILQVLPPADRLVAMRPLLTDSRRNVRVEAAKRMLDVPPRLATGSGAAILQRAIEEWQQTIVARLDFPETHLVLAGTALTMRNFTAAQDAFREVVLMDPQRAEAWVMLVRLAAALEGPESARQVLVEAQTKIANDPVLQSLASELE